MQDSTPKQCKLLGAHVRGLGVVVAVTTSLRYGFAIVEDQDGCARNLYFRDLNPPTAKAVGFLHHRALLPLGESDMHSDRRLTSPKNRRRR